MSRMKIIVKRWPEVKTLNFSGIRETQRAVTDKKNNSNKGDFDEYQEVQFMADNCPKLYSIREMSGSPYDFSNKRLIDIMCALGSEDK
jgi:hypothetical protein